MTQDVFAAALAYTERGMRVIPIAPNSKIPIKDFPVAKYTQQAPTRAELSLWFENTNNNIAALMKSSGMFLVDVDQYKPDFKASSIIPELEQSTHLRAMSPRGGLHFFFKASDNLPLHDTQGVITAVDTKYLGYALLPPSQIDGKPYRWIEVGEPGIPPASIIRKLADRADATTTDNKPEALSLLHQVVKDGFTPGQHNEQLRDLGRLLARALNSPSDEFRRQTYLELMTALDARDPTPQAKEGHLLPTINAAWKYEAKPQAAPVEAGQPFLEMDNLTQMAEKYSDYTLEYLIDTWLPKNAILIMAAPPETYKTWLLLDMAISLAFGNKDSKGFMGRFAVPNKATPVLIFQQEDYPGQVFQRMGTIMHQKLKDVTWDFEEIDGGWKFDHPLYAPIYLHNDAQLSFDNPDSMLMLERRVKETGAQAVFIDPLYSLGDSSDYFAKMAREFQTIKRIRKENNTAFVIAHHNRKSGGDGRDKVYGSVLLNGASEGVILLDALENGEIRISRSGKFFPNKVAYRISFDIDTATGVYKVNVEDDSADTRGKYDDLILRLVTEKPMTQKQLIDELDLPQGTISRALTRMKKSAILATQGRKYVLGTDTEGF